MNWLDKYLMKPDGEYLVSDKGELFVGIDAEHVRPVSENCEPSGMLREISKEEFISRLVRL